MATSINAYSVALNLDASQYIKNSNLSRKETASLTRSINAARTPADKYSREVQKLEKALAAGAIDQRVYNKLLDTAADKYRKAASSATIFDKAVGAIRGKVLAGGAAFAAMAGGAVTIGGLTSAARELGQTMADIDAAAKQSKAIGVTFNQMQAFRMAAGEFAGVEGAQAGELLAKLSRRAGDAANGLGESVKAFELLNITVADLAGKNPVELYKLVADRIAEIEDPTKRASAAAKLFEAEGKKLIPLLAEGGAAIEEYTALIDSLGISMEENAVAKIEAVNDNLARLASAWTGVKVAILSNQEVMNGLLTTIQEITGAVSGLAKILPTIAKYTPAGLIRSIDQMDTYEPTVTQRARAQLAGVKREKEAERLAQHDLSVKIPKDFAAPVVGAFQGFASGMLGGLTSVGSAIVTNATQNSQAEIAANTESPAIQSLEVGTQEAYKFMNDQQAELLNIEKAKEKKQAEANAKAEEIGNESNRLLGIISDWAQENGFQPIR